MSQSWHSPDGYSDLMGVWSDEAKAYDGDTGTYAYAPQNNNAWQQWLSFTYSNAITGATKMRIWVSHELGATPIEWDIHLYNATQNQNLYQANLVHDQYVEISGITLSPITYFKVRFLGQTAVTFNVYVNEVAIWADDAPVVITAGGGAFFARKAARFGF